MTSHEAEVKRLLGAGKAGEALAYLARQLDALEAARAAAPSLDWSVSADPRAYIDVHTTGEVVHGKEWPIFEGGPVLNTYEFGWDGSPDTWTKEIGEGMHRKAIELIGDPLPGDDGQWAAQRQLASDLLTPPTRDVLYIEGENLRNSSYTTTESDEDVVVEAPTYSEEEQEEHRQFALQMGWDKADWLMPTGGQPIIETFVKGGPLVMFLGYREYLEQIPPAMIQRMIAMHARRFPKDAAQMTADLLRAEDNLDYETALDTAGRRSNTLNQ